MKLQRLHIAVSCLATFATSGCDNAPLTWREELKLIDGRTIVATKTEMRPHGGHLAAPTGQPVLLDTEIRFPDPDDRAKIYNHSIEGESGYLMIDFDHGVPWIVGHAGTGHRSYAGCGDEGSLSYVTFKWNGSRFERVPYATLPAKFADPNTVPVSWAAEDLPDREPISHYRVAGQLKALCAATGLGCELQRPPPGSPSRGCFSASGPISERE